MKTMKIRQTILEQRYLILVMLALCIFLFYPNVGIYDWDKEVLYTAYIKTSLQDFHQFPYLLWNSAELAGYPAVDQSIFFPANPETLLFSPFLPFLLFLSPPVFLKLMVVIHALIGIAGVFALGKRLAWDQNQIAIFSALFMLSPIVIQHIAIGYLPWMNLYFFPWLLFFLFSKKPVKRCLGSGMVLAITLLQGGLHVFVWMAFFMAFYGLACAVANKKIGDLIQPLLSVLAAILLALPRFYISLQSFSSFSQKFFSGYSLRAFLQWGLIPPFFTPQSMDDIEYFIEGYIDGVPYWDGELFWGFLLILVVLLPWMFSYLHREKDQAVEPLKQVESIAFASMILLLFSFGSLYEKGIVFLSEAIALPALQGMEKYPFRFAIPAYFGFSFVIAATWKEMPLFLGKVFAWVKRALLILWNAVLQVADWLRSRKKILRWVFIISLILCIAVLGMESAIMSTVRSMIEAAYSGEGAAWLQERMEYSAAIPLERYFAKAATLYRYIIRFLMGIVILTAFSCILSYLSKNMAQREMPISQGKPISKGLLEVLLVAPLILSFGMWWRVAFATPQHPEMRLALLEPVITATDGETLSEMRISFTPSSLQITFSEANNASTLVFEDINAADGSFLQIEDGSAALDEWQTHLAIHVHDEEEEKILISVKKEQVWKPCLIAGIGWLLAGWMMHRSRDPKPKKGPVD